MCVCVCVCGGGGGGGGGIVLTPVTPFTNSMDKLLRAQKSVGWNYLLLIHLLTSTVAPLELGMGK